jgi:hypothetical protein
MAAGWLESRNLRSAAACQITQTLPVFVHTLNIRLPHWDDSYTMQEV